MISIKSGQQGEAAILQVSGRIDAATAPEFERACRDMVTGGTKLLVLDFAGLQYMSSAGLRSLLLIRKGLEEAGGTLRLANVTGAVGQVLELSGFYAFFSCFDSVEQAATS